MKELIAKSGQDTYVFGQLPYNGHFISTELCTEPLNDGERRTLKGWNTLLAGTDKRIPDTELVHQQMRRVCALRNNEKYWGTAQECLEGLRKTFEKHWHLMLATCVNHLQDLEATISHLGIEPRTSSKISIPEFPEQNEQCNYLLLALQRPADLPIIGYLETPKLPEEVSLQVREDADPLSILLLLYDEAGIPYPSELDEEIASEIWRGNHGKKDVIDPQSQRKKTREILQKISAIYVNSRVPEPEALREQTNPMLEALFGKFYKNAGTAFQYCASRCSGPSEMMRTIRIWTLTKEYRKSRTVVAIGSDDTGSGQLGFGLDMTLPENHPMPALWVRKLEN